MYKSINLLALKLNSNRIIQFTAYFLLIFTNCVDCKVGMRNMAKFYLQWS